MKRQTNMSPFQPFHKEGLYQPGTPACPHFDADLNEETVLTQDPQQSLNFEAAGWGQCS